MVEHFARKEKWRVVSGASTHSSSQQLSAVIIQLLLFKIVGSKIFQLGLYNISKHILLLLNKQMNLIKVLVVVLIVINYF